MISVEVTIRAQFYDLDPMQVVWHGNYARFLEEARCSLLNLIGYNYEEMAESGYMWPIVDMRLKYVAPIRFGQDFVVTAKLVEYQNRLRIDYVITDKAEGTVLTKAQTTQLAVALASKELCLECPAALVERVERLLP